MNAWTPSDAYAWNRYGDVFPKALTFDEDEYWFCGWWMRDDETGEWTGAADASAKVADGTHLYARWTARRVAIEVRDAGGSGAFDGWAGHMDSGAPPSTAGLDAAPKREGYMLAGLWLGDDQYFAGGAGDGNGWELGRALRYLTSWDGLDRATEDRTGPDGTPDGVADTLVLDARWDIAVRATVPMQAALRLTGSPWSKPDVAMQADGYAITSYTVVPLTVASIQAEGADGPGGLGGVLYTSGEGAGRRLAYREMGGDMRLTIESLRGGPSTPGGGATDLTIASASADAATTSSASLGGPTWTIGASDATGSERMGMRFGLSLPDNVRAYESGRGDIATVTFTITATQQMP